LVAMINSALISCFYLRVPFIKITKLTESKHFLMQKNSGQGPEWTRKWGVRVKMTFCTVWVRRGSIN